jgi:hypothetical protein
VPTQRRLRDTAAALSKRWDELSTESLHGLLRAILVRVQVHSDRIALDIDAARLITTLLEYEEANLSESTLTAKDGDERQLIALTIPACLKRTGIETKFIVAGVENRDPPNASLVRVVLRAQALGKRRRRPSRSPFYGSLQRQRAFSHSLAQLPNRATGFGSASKHLVLNPDCLPGIRSSAAAGIRAMRVA